MIFKEGLTAAASKNNIQLSDKQLEAFNCYYEMLNNRKYIWDTAITVETIIDCLSWYDSAIFPVNGRVIDVATGAGFPGIPLKILRSDIQLCLLDISDNRMPFWREVVDHLALSDVTMVQASVVDVGYRPEYHEQYQVAMSRGLSFHLSKLVESCLPLVKPGGYYIAFEFERTKDEVPEAAASIAAMGGELSKTVPREIESRIFVYVKKISQHQYNHCENKKEVSEK